MKPEKKRGRRKDAAEMGSTEDAAEPPTEGDGAGDTSFEPPLNTPAPAAADLGDDNGDVRLPPTQLIQIMLSI